MGFKIKINKILLVFSIIIIILFSISLVSASNEDVDNLTLLNDDKSYSSLNINVQDTTSQNYIINQRNFKMYFDDNNNLKSDYSGQIITFDGEFKDKGTITINGNNTKITGRNNLFTNTAFNIKANGVMLTNLNFVLNGSFKNNENSGIYISGDNVTLYNINMEYNTPSDVDAIGIYSHENIGFNLINSSFKYIGHACHKGHNYPILLYYSDNTYICGNNINSSLPLREITYSQGFLGDKISSFAAGYSKNLQLTNNTVYSDINFGDYQNGVKYPTLSSVLIYACDNSTINMNKIIVEDLHTRKNIANYLYALDIYRLNDVSIVENTIDVFTYGGYGRDGTAYPIQITGPAYNLKVAYNYLHSVSNGPNIGIYSQNYYGSTQIDIISNFINITGKASMDAWSLVAGIEVQDSNDKILNNTIIIDTVGGYKAGDRVYGISYSQGTNGNHKYDIRYNNVTTPGPIAISLNQGTSSTTSDTNVMYNILVTGIGEGGDRSVSIGGNGQNNIIRYNTNRQDTNRHMSEHELPEWIKNYQSGTRNGNGINLAWLNNNNEENGNGIGNNNGSGNGISINSNINGNNIHHSNSDAIHGDANSTHYKYGESGVNIASASSSSGSSDSSPSSNSKTQAYEITKQIPEITDINYIQSIIGILLILMLLIIGYMKKDYIEEEY